MPDSLMIGKYELYRDTENKIWIVIHGDGEGGVFNEADLEKVIDKFYADNF